MYFNFSHDFNIKYMKNNYLNKRLTCQQGKYFAVDKQNETKTHFI